VQLSTAQRQKANLQRALAHARARGHDAVFETARWQTVDFARIDVVLVSHQHTLLGLPYVTEYSSFRGAVYSTDPTLRLGGLLMRQLAALSHDADGGDAAASSAAATQASLRSHLPLASDAAAAASDYGGGGDTVLLPTPGETHFRLPYTRRDVDACVAKVTCVAFNEPISLGHATSAAVTLQAVSSGYSVGGM
jgi:integrator complex subunit 9